MAYSKDYIELQIEFAKKVSEITSLDFKEAILKYTGFYITFRIQNYDFNPNHPTWSEYLDYLGSNTSAWADKSYEFYLVQVNKDHPKDQRFSKKFGCFFYELDEQNNCIYIHFKNKMGGSPSSLSFSEKNKRIHELKAMFSYINEKKLSAAYVCGHSWLYNIEAYNRLFPPTYIKSAKVNREWFGSTALWGQFVDNDGEIKRDIADRFRNCIASAVNLDELKQCFEHPVLEPESRIEVFFKFYGI